VSIIWRKVWRDLVDNKARTLLTVLSVAVGVFALGVIYGAYDVISSCLDEIYWATVPTHVTFWVWPSDRAAEDAVSRVPGVAAVDRWIATSCGNWKARLAGATEL
jgi:putative ABC transport system permease protein